MHFIDECSIQVKAGKGGDGVLSWRREANVPLGGPYGGDGGNGGDIIIIGDHNVNTLFDIHNKKIISAPNGDNGRTAKEYGKNGQSIYIHVPLGTSVYDKHTNELIVDITTSGQEFIVAKGGRGGHGNAFFKSPFNRAPSLYERGELGEQKDLFLQLRYLADVGIVGLPNAGKSTFIGKVANAKPKVASYQFTTLTPILGVVSHKNDKMVFSDMPGLIEGASQGKGLGHDFLKHIERCTILIHMISLNKEDNEDPDKAYQLIKNELKQYSFSLLEKPIIIVASKADVADAKSQFSKLKKKIGKQPLFVISANKNEGIEPLLDYIFALHHDILLANKKQQEAKQKNVKVIELKQQKDFSLDLKIYRDEQGIWIVDSEYMKYWTNRIPLTTKDNIMRYNQKMQTIGVEQKAKELGAKIGETINIYGNILTID